MPSLTVIGLALDIIGAGFLAKSIFTKNPSVVAEEISTRLGYSAPLAWSIASSQIESWLGLALLALGFLGQLLGSLKFDPALACRLAIGLIIIGVSALIIVLPILRRLIIYQYQRIIIQWLRKNHPLDKVLNDTDKNSKLLGLRDSGDLARILKRGSPKLLETVFSRKISKPDIALDSGELLF